MLVPSIFNDSFFEGFPFFDGRRRPPAPPRGGAHRISRMANVMKTDVKETEEGYEVMIDLPGYKKEDIEVELKDGFLTITASKNEEKSEEDKENGRYICRERYVGTASRSFYVGDNIGQEDIKAGFEEGILKLDISKKDEPKVEEKKLIDIK